ncbi:hypothetical protein F52700_11137 [Fusarium sp. NRRL 52700]|nr:hypothetical protein F52700_11137 [Fusarium sp. NRRL 52700]
MSDSIQLPSNEEIIPSYGYVFIAISPPLNLNFKPRFNFKVPSHWMVAVFNPIPKKWLTAQGRQNDARYVLIKGEAAPDNSKFFYVGKFPVSELATVEARIRSVVPEENSLGEVQFERQYVRDVLKNLVDGGILQEDRARDNFLAAETWSLQLN